MLTQQRLKELLHYDPATGEWTWIRPTSNRIKAGGRAGVVNSNGYRLIHVGGQRQLAHRLAWLYMTGKWPAGLVDHKNRVKSDNRWSNLRQASKAQNAQNACRQRNNTSGYKGVHRRGRRWGARIKVAAKYVWLGSFDTAQEAHAAYLAAAKKHFGQFARAV